MWELAHDYGRTPIDDHHDPCCSGVYCCPCCGCIRGEGTGDDNYIAEPAYLFLHHKIVLAVLGTAVDPTVETEIAAKDWTADMKHQQRRDPESVLMNRSTFFTSIHRLIDLWTEKICQEE